MPLGCVSAIQHIEELTAHCDSVLRTHEDIMVFLLTIRKRFPSLEVEIEGSTIPLASENETSDDSDGVFEEERPVPNFWSLYFK